jgi:hypothetical protein
MATYVWGKLTLVLKNYIINKFETYTYIIHQFTDYWVIEAFGD